MIKFPSPNAVRPMHTYSPEERAVPQTAASEGDEVDGFSPIKLTRGDLRPGDVLLYCKEPQDATISHNVIMAGQALSGPIRSKSNNGNPRLVHALIYTHSPGNPLRDTTHGHGEVEIVEMAGTTLSARGGELEAGLYRVYRPRNEQLGQASAQIGMCWAESGKQMPYSKQRAMLSAALPSDFTASAQRNVVRYADQAFEASPQWGQEGAFCSHFVMAAYQAGAYHLETQSAPQSCESDEDIVARLSGALKANAQYVSVRKLDNLLRNDTEQFESMGHLRVTEDDVISPMGTLPAAARQQAQRSWWRPWSS